MFRIYGKAAPENAVGVFSGAAHGKGADSFMQR
jgi:hypothetical protein